MRRVSAAIRDNLWIRLAVLFVVAVAVGWYMLPADTKIILQLKAARYLGPPIIGASVLGGLTLWITYELAPALWVFFTTLILVTGLMAVLANVS